MHKALFSIWEEPRASDFDAMREKARKKGKITFDCHNAMYPQKGNLVRCRLGHKMGTNKDGYMHLYNVMAGRTGVGCRRCPDFDGEP